MNGGYWAIAITIIGQIAYHVGQKSVPKAASPFVVLAAAYAVGCALCLLLLPMTGRMPNLADLRLSAGWPTWLIAMSVVGIEIGYLLAYRAGWSMGTAYATSSTATVVALFMIGAALSGDAVGSRRIMGFSLACASLWLLNTGPEGN